MKRRTSALFALAAASGAALALTIPAMAQTYIPYTNTFEATGNPGQQTGEDYTIKQYVAGQTAKGYWDPGWVQPEQSTLLNEGSGGSQSYNYVGNTNYTLLASNNPDLFPGTPTNGAGTFYNGNNGPAPASYTYQDNVQARSGSQSVLTSWLGGSSATTGFYRCTTVGTPNVGSPTIDLGGTVSFWVYFDTGLGGAANSSTNPSTTSISAPMQVELVVNSSATTTLTGDPTALGKRGNGAGSVAALYAVGTTNATGVAGSSGKTGTGSNGFPTGGHTVQSGTWTFVSFNIPAETSKQITGTAAPLPTSGLGYLNDIDFTTGDGMPGGVANKPNQVFNVYIDDLTIAPAPEPSAWLALAAGGVMLLGLGAMKARKRGMGAA